MRLTLPEEILGQKVVLGAPEGEGQGGQEVHAVPLGDGQLDPVLEEAVASQPRVEQPEEEPREPEEQVHGEEAPARRGKGSLGFLALLGAGAIAILGLALGARGGAHAHVPSSGGGGAQGPSAPRPEPDLY